jgi:predicted ArsR family transcriptional regulator
MAESWTFLTNHARVLLLLADDREARMRDMGEAIGITERAVQRIVADLEAAGYIAHERVGRRNRYEVREDEPMRHRLQAGHTIGELVESLRLIVPD